jgi:hypothetical protein
VEALTPPDRRAGWCFPNGFRFTDEAGFTGDGTVNFYNSHVWVDDIPQTTVTSRNKHRFSINVWVGILGVQFL